MCGACTAYGGKEWRVQDFGGENYGKDYTGETKCRMQDNINLDLQDVRCGKWTGSNCLRIGTCVDHL